MIKDSLTIIACVLLFSATAMPSISSSFYSSGYDRYSENVVVSVEIAEKGLYNLVVSIQSFDKPKSFKSYNTDTYKDMMQRFMVEARGITVRKILNRKEISVSDFSVLREEIDAELTKLADELAYKYFPNKQMILVYSISNFFLLKPGDD